MEQLLLRVAEAGEVLGISRSLTYQLIRDGELPFVLVGKSKRVPVVGLQKWIKRQLKNQPAER
jgi:excisionase family DNA binding protein